MITREVIVGMFFKAKCEQCWEPLDSHSPMCPVVRGESTSMGAVPSLVELGRASAVVSAMASKTKVVIGARSVEDAVGSFTVTTSTLSAHPSVAPSAMSEPLDEQTVWWESGYEFGAIEARREGRNDMCRAWQKLPLVQRLAWAVLGRLPK